jgi:predicted nuclease of predicted toxin-antitoxin system
MKIKLDENLPEELKGLLAERGHDVQSVPDESLIGRHDEVIFEASQREARMLLTQDLDFSDVRKFRPGTHPGVVVIRLREPSRRGITARMRQVLDEEPIDRWAGCFVVISDRKLRVRRGR